MSSFTSLFDKIKSHNYSIITAIIVGIVTAIYLLIIVPNNEVKEDANNLAILKGIEVQLKSYIDDKLQGISPEQMDSIKKKKTILGNSPNWTPKSSQSFYIDKIEIESLKSTGLPRNKLLLTRKIYFKKEDASKTIESFCIQDEVKFDLDEFINRINAASSFKSFFICPVTVFKDKKNKGQCITNEVLISQNISPKEEDSLCLQNSTDGHITFEKSSKRFYANQVKIPNTNFTLFLAAGISSSYFKSNVLYIKPNHLIFGLLLISILFLSICFIKPIVLSYRELLSQMDLIRLVFSIGAMIAIFTIFGMVNFWETTISKRNKSDLKQLVEYIDGSFKNQINTLKVWEKSKITTDSFNGSKFPFRKLYIDKDSAITLMNGDSLIYKNSNEWNIIKTKRGNKIQLLEAKKFEKADSLKQLKFLDVYFWMNKDGLLTASLDKDNSSFPRRFNDRGYFKLLQNKEINTVLTGVFSRENDEYQWIYAEKDNKQNSAAGSEKFAIKGIAFREQFSKEIKLPPDTDFMLVDRKGSVLAQQDPTKKLYQNVLLGSDNNLILASVLAGCDIQNFKIDYQGNTYQVYAKKLSVPTDLPVYILGIRNLSYLDYLGQFTFINSILIVLAYGIIIIFLILIYSSLFYSGRIGFFAREHFYHLFHDYGKKKEYKHLLIVNCICFLIALGVFLFSSPITALYICLLLIFNITFINVVILNSRFKISKDERFVFYLLVLIFSFSLPLFLLYKDHLYISLILIIASHIVLIRLFLIWKRIDSTIPLTTDILTEPKVVQRKAYLYFLTSGLLNHFVMFPFILVCVFYSNELNDYARYYCSSSHADTKSIIQKRVETYGCGCITQEPLLNLGSNNESIIHKLNFGFEDPTRGVVNYYTFKEFSKKFYFKIRIILTEAGSNLFFIILGFFFILLLAYSLLNYYSNRFFFFELMQISYSGYYPRDKTKLTDIKEYIAEVFGSSTKNSNTDSDYEIRRKEINKAIESAFETDKKHEVIPFFRNEFKLNSELKYFDNAYSNIWESLPNVETQNVLYDFAQDHFSNYKNKDILMELMDLGLINHNELTGRLQIRSESFRKYILLKSKLDAEFVVDFKKVSSNGTFDKLRLPMLIIATSLLLLLMYLNKDRYNQLEVMGASIGTVLVLVNRFLSIGRS